MVIACTIARFNSFGAYLYFSALRRQGVTCIGDKINHDLFKLNAVRLHKAKVTAIEHRIDIQSLVPTPAEQLLTNEVGRVRLQLQQAIPCLPYTRSRGLGAMVLVDTTSHQTSAAVLIEGSTSNGKPE